ncbi:MAG: LPS assembly lipoprotein LptE [Candidatus Kapaibacterium sp.]|nr:LPS assembly lipoprotein LptE [Candidatus Kapabacteria bacterium]
MKLYIAIYFFVIANIAQGCYSFTGGTAPAHLNTMTIQNVNDNSGFGNPQYREILTENIFELFLNDNTYEIVDVAGDARLTVVINAIRESSVSINPGELETERKVEVICEVEFYDNIKRNVIMKRSISSYDIYAVADSQTGRENAVRNALSQLADDVLLAVVSGW